MGTDIHLFVEVRKNGVWHRVNPPRVMDEFIAELVAAHPQDSYYSTCAKVLWYDTRNYSVFAILANVRNGHGFAGVLTGEGFNFISTPRGLPCDLSVEVRQAIDDCGEHGDLWIGDHSVSWLTLAEIDAFDWKQTTRQCGVIPMADYIQRLLVGDTSRPRSYSGGVFGDGIVVIEETDAKLIATYGMEWPAPKTYVHVWWESLYADAAADFYNDFLPELRKLGAPEDVRIVFGFDS